MHSPNGFSSVLSVVQSLKFQRGGDVIEGARMMITTTHAYRDYVFRIEYGPKEPAYTVEFVDIPEIITSGSTLNEAFGNACEALDLHLESLQKLGKELPPHKHRLVVEAA